MLAKQSLASSYQEKKKQKFSEKMSENVMKIGLCFRKNDVKWLDALLKLPLTFQGSEIKIEVIRATINWDNMDF